MSQNCLSQNVLDLEGLRQNKATGALYDVEVCEYGDNGDEDEDDNDAYDNENDDAAEGGEGREERGEGGRRREGGFVQNDGRGFILVGKSKFTPGVVR